MVEDSELLRRFAREGCQTSFAELVTRHINRAYAVALRCVGGDAHLLLGELDLSSHGFVRAASRPHEAAQLSA